MAAARERPVRAALIGSGAFGRTLLAQVRGHPVLSVPVVCDREPERALAALRGAGVPEERILRPGPRASAASAFDPEKVLVLEDAGDLSALPVDVVVEATGEPEAGARHALAAIRAGRHVAMVTKETDVVIGPILDHLARRAGLTYTLVDGDQPGLLIKLVDWARRLNFAVVAAGKATEFDAVAAPDLTKVTALGRDFETPGLAEAWRLDGAALSDVLARRAEILAGAPRQTTPDLCEMAIVANATGLRPDRADLHAPFARSMELAEVFQPAADGGLIERPGAVDVFACLRRRDELSFAGGVFVVVACPDAETARLFRAKGLPTSVNGKHLMVHNPVHLLGAEAPISILAAGQCTAPAVARAQRVDLVAETTQPLPAGSELALGPRHDLAGTTPRLVPARPLGPNAPAPYYLAAGARLRRDLPAGATITLGNLEIAEDSSLLALRRQQDDELTRPEDGH